MIVDPSHADGRRDLVLPLSLAGIAAGADGVLVEMHPNPEHALCDGPQSLSPAAFAEYAARVRRAGPLDRQGRSRNGRGVARSARPHDRASSASVSWAARWGSPPASWPESRASSATVAAPRRSPPPSSWEPSPRRRPASKRPPPPPTWSSCARRCAWSSSTCAARTRSAAPDAVVSDVGSTKAMLMDALTPDEQSRCVGGHPLCGSETAGVRNARASLYEGATYFLTPGAHVRPAAFQKLYDFLVQIGARPVAVEPTSTTASWPS